MGCKYGSFSEEKKGSIHNLENHIGQLIKMISNRLLGTLPSNTEKNSKEHAKAITLRSGKELVVTPMVVSQEDSEEVPEEYTSSEREEKQ